MLISEKYKFIFIHIQKTGGTSITQFLSKEINDLKPLCYKHDGVTEGIEVMGLTKWKKYFKFAYIRNPWDRLVSWYSMIINTPEKVTKLRLYARENSFDFDSFLQNCTKSINDVDGIQSFAKNQYDYLYDKKGNKMVDYIGKFENYTQSWNEVSKIIGISTNHTLPRINHSSIHKHYSRYYSKMNEDLIRNRFKKDIDTFGYKFEKYNILNLLIDLYNLKFNKKTEPDLSIDYLKAIQKGGFN